MRKKRKTDCGGWRAFPMPPLENAERAEKTPFRIGMLSR